MNIIESFQLRGKVESVRVGDDNLSLLTRTAQKIQLIQGHGVKGDLHSGSRLLDVREHELLSLGFMKGMEIAPFRQVSIVSTEELKLIQEELGLPDPIPYGYLGENIVLSGVPDLSWLPPGTLLSFQKPNGTPRTAVVGIWRQNEPCVQPGEAIQTLYGPTGTIARHFSKAAMGRRGVVGPVYVSGVVHEGDIAIVVVPRQRLYVRP